MTALFWFLIFASFVGFIVLPPLGAFLLVAVIVVALALDESAGISLGNHDSKE